MLYLFLGNAQGDSEMCFKYPYLCGICECLGFEDLEDMTEHILCCGKTVSLSSTQVHPILFVLKKKYFTHLVNVINDCILSFIFNFAES